MRSIPVVEATILDPAGNTAPFKLSIYGVPFEELMVSPGGGDRIRLALERRGLAGYTSSPFLLRVRRYEGTKRR